MAKQPVTEALRRKVNAAIASGDESFIGLERKTGVLRQTIMGFARGEQTILLASADALMNYFGLTVSDKPQRRQVKTKGR